ncbi:MAG: DUF4332 domain-containing protein [Pirellulaceae bacterium]
MSRRREDQNLLFRVLRKAACANTHHKLALDSLMHLNGPMMEQWRNLFLRFNSAYLDGSKAPDKEFKDFRNHVIHVRQNNWGGAVGQAQKWYQRAVEEFKQSHWEKGVYCCGVLGHYYSDPLMPLHTGQSDAEAKMHRACEWTVNKSYDRLIKILEILFEYPTITLTQKDDWLEQVILEGAKEANQHYESLIEHYSLEKGVRSPEQGLDKVGQSIISQMLGRAMIGNSRILERVFAGAAVRPPDVVPSLHAIVATLKVPAHIVVNQIEDAQERAIVNRVYREVRRTGHARESLPVEQIAVRNAFQFDEQKKGEQQSGNQQSPAPAQQTDVRRQRQSEPPTEQREEREDNAVTRQSTEPRRSLRFPKWPQWKIGEQIGGMLDWARGAFSRRRRGDGDRDDSAGDAERETLAADAKQRVERPVVRPAERPVEPPVEPVDEPQPEPRTQHAGSLETKFYLQLDDELVAAPSIGKKTARRFARIGVATVDDFFAIKPAVAADGIDARHITEQTIRQWQDQAKLVCQIPGLRGHDAQILVGCDYRHPNQIAQADPDEMLAKVEPYIQTREGQWAVRSGKAPDRVEVVGWIANAGRCRKLRAAA